MPLTTSTRGLSRIFQRGAPPCSDNNAKHSYLLVSLRSLQVSLPIEIQIATQINAPRAYFIRHNDSLIWCLSSSSRACRVGYRRWQLSSEHSTTEPPALYPRPIIPRLFFNSSASVFKDGFTSNPGSASEVSDRKFPLRIFWIFGF